MAALCETICSEIVLSCTREFGATMQAVVLTGSLARDEATAVFKRDLAFFSSDADCLLVFPATIEPSTERLARLSAEIEKRLFTAGIEVAIGLAAVAPAYFDELPAHSYTYELRNSGKVLWGEAALLSRIPSYTVAQLSKEDAWRTLSNRIIETLMSVANSESQSRRFSVETEYAVTKLYLDMATSYLIFIGEYEPTYAARARRLAELAARNAAEAPFIVATFSSRVSSATDCKLKGVGCAPVRSSLEEAMTYSQQLWRWEAARLSGEPWDLPVLDLAVGVTRKQTVAARLRGWASLLRRTGWFRGARQWPRWTRLSISASPRHLIYAAAVQLFWNVPSLVSDDATNRLDYSELQALLPVVPASNEPATWNSLVQAVGLNYRVFLHGTLA
jgi:predicted nucleotidyltransferase